MRILSLCFMLLWITPLSANQWQLSSAMPALTDTLTIDFRVDKAQQGDLYLAVQVPYLAIQNPNESGFYFINADANLVKTASAFKQNSVLNGSYSLFSIAVRTLPTGTYHLYAVIVKTGANPYDSNQWLTEGLNYTTFTVAPPSEVNLDYLCTPPEKWHAEMSHCMIM